MINETVVVTSGACGGNVWVFTSLKPVWERFGQPHPFSMCVRVRSRSTWTRPNHLTPALTWPPGRTFFSAIWPGRASRVSRSRPGRRTSLVHNQNIDDSAKTLRQHEKLISPMNACHWFEGLRNKLKREQESHKSLKHTIGHVHQRFGNEAVL